MKIYIGDTVKPKYRWQLFPLIKPYFSASGLRTKNELEAKSIASENVIFVDAISIADVAVLPMSWNYYYTHNLLAEALAFVSLAKENNKKVWSFTSGDFGVEVPFIEQVIVFRLGGLKSKLPETHKGMPSFIEDPLPKHLNKTKIDILPLEEKPVVSFCGQANSSILNGLKEVGKTTIRNLKTKYSNRNLDAQPIISTSMLRASLLDKLKSHPKIATNYILRAKYRAGVTSTEGRAKTTAEFYDNLNSSPYVLCVRGAGNFSIRFYEALALGRIPVFVNTDCLLPLDDLITWKKHIVWVAFEDRKRIGELLLDFHRSHTVASFKKLQQDNRALWEKSLTLKAFFNF